MAKRRVGQVGDRKRQALRTVRPLITAKQVGVICQEEAERELGTNICLARQLDKTAERTSWNWPGDRRRPRQNDKLATTTTSERPRKQQASETVHLTAARPTWARANDKRQQQLLASNSNCARQQDGHRANDYQMLWATASRLNGGAQLSVGCQRLRPEVTTTTTTTKGVAAIGGGGKAQRRLRIKLIGQQKRGQEFIRPISCCSRPRRKSLPSPLADAMALFVLTLVVMQIIAILPSCLIIYHAVDCGRPVSAPDKTAPGPANWPAASLADEQPARERRSTATDQKVHVRLGILLEESNHEQANMFIRTIKMINDQKDETIRRLLNMFSAAKRAGGNSGGGNNYLARVRRLKANEMQTIAVAGTNPHQRRDEGLAAAARLGRRATGRNGADEAVGTSSENQLDEEQEAGKIKSTRHNGGPNELYSKRANSLLAAPTNWRHEQVAGVFAQMAAQQTSDFSSGTAQLNQSAYGAAAHMKPDAGHKSRHRAGTERHFANSTAGRQWTESISQLGAPDDDDLPETSGHTRLKRAQQHQQQSSFDIELEPMIEFLLDRQSALEADEKVCQLIESGVYAIFGPIDGRSIQHVQSICDNLEIPYFELRPFISGAGVGISLPNSMAAAPTPQQQQQQQQKHQQVPLASSLAREVKTTIETADERRRGDENSDKMVRSEEFANSNLGNDFGFERDVNEDNDDDGETGAIYANHRQPVSSASAQSKSTTNNKRHVVINDANGEDVVLTETDHVRYSTDDRVPPSPPSPPLTLGGNKLEALTLNLYPPSHLLNSAYIDLIHALNWTSFAIVYEDSASMIRLQNIFKESSPINSWTNKWRIRLFRHDPDGLYGEYSGEVDGLRSTSQVKVDVETKTSASNVNNLNNNDLKQHKSSHNANQMSRVNSTTGNGATVAPPSGRSANWFKRNATLMSSLYLTTNNHDEESPTRPVRETTSEQQTFSQDDKLRNKKHGAGGTYRDVFWRVKLSGEHNILLDIKTENLYEALKQSLQVGCMTEEYSYLITSLDLHTLDLEDFKYSRTKITGFSLTQVARQRTDNSGSSDLINTSPIFDEKYLENLGVYLIQQMSETTHQNQKVRERQSQNKVSRNQQQKLQQQQTTTTTTNPNGSRERQQAFFDWLNNEAENNDQTRRELLQSSPASLSLLPTVDRNNEQKLFDFFLEQQDLGLSRVRLSTSSAIIHDSLILYMLGLNEMDPSGNFLNINQQHHSNRCALDSRPWLHGSSLVNYMKQMTFNGLTGFVSFDQRGLRTDFKLDVLGMAPNIRLVKIGEWHSKYADEKLFPFNSQNQLNSPGATQTRGQLRTATRASSVLIGESDVQSQPTGGESITPMDDFDQDESNSYDELSSRYEIELKHYNELVARGEPFQVPYKKRASPNGALLVNNIIFERLYREQSDKVDTLIVSAKLSQPYFMLRETPNKLEGNDQFEGYAVDLIHELSKLVNFKYKWRETADKKYGSKELLPNGTIVWNGMIGEIVRGTADLAIVDLTITAQREEAVDFTLPFMNTGISILFKKPTTKVTTLFSFLSPFSSDVWAYVLAAYCGISAILFLVGHLSPYEWADPHPCRHMNPDGSNTVLKNQFTLLNSFWFTIGSLMQQGSDLTPRSMSTRTIAGIWYFFTLIMISSYTANLAAFLTVEKVVYPIENVRDLSNQQEIKYGCVESGSTCLFFHDSQIDTYKKIDETMRLHRTYVRSNDEGQKRVGEGKFAFFMESTTIEYIIERNCNLTQIGGLLDSKGYGIALAKKSRHKRPYRTLLNEGILHLQETGMLHVLKNRWWKEKRGGGTCTDDGKGGGVTELSLANVGGVFVVLLGGLGISFLVAIAEFIWRARRGGSSRDRMCEEMMNDLKFALACKSSTKPIQRTNKSSRRGSQATVNGQCGPNKFGPVKTMNDTQMMRQRFAGLAGDRNRFRGNLSNGFIGNNNSELLTAKLAKCAANESSATNTNGKRCNPILLHAMLTMLSTDEPTQVLPTGRGLTTSGGRQDGHLFTRPGNLVHGANQMMAPFVVGRQRQQPVVTSSSVSKMAHSFSLGDDQFRSFASEDSNQFGRRSAQFNRNGFESDRQEEDEDDDDIEDDYYEQHEFEGNERDNNQRKFNANNDQAQDDGDDDATTHLAEQLNAQARYRLTSERSSNAPELLAAGGDLNRRRMLHSQKTIDID